MCDFIIYTFKDVKVFRIEKYVDFISNMTNKLESFYKDHFRQALLDNFFYRNYNCYSF